MTKQYWYPFMSNAEIMTALSGWGINVSNEQLVKPSPDFVIGLYSACLEQITSLSQNSFSEPIQAALASLEDSNTDLYSASLAQNIVLYHITRLAVASKVPDFNVKDLYLPQPERTRSILSAFVNYVKFSEQRAAFVSDLQERSITAIEDRERISRELEEIEEKLFTLKAQRAQDGPRCAQLQQENAAITTQLMATKDSQAAAVKEIEALKVEKASVIQSKENLNKDTALASDAITRTRSRIVQSPERIKRTITTMGSTAIEDRKTVVMHESKARDLQTKITALLNIEKDVRACMEQLQTIEKEMAYLDISQKELADLKDHLDDKQIERNELHMKQERVQKQYSNAIEKLERAQRHVEDKRIANQQTIDRLQREYEEMAMERRQNDKEVEELKAEADEVATKMSEHLKKSEADLNELLTEYWHLRHQTEVYMETLANKLGMQVSAG